MKSLIERKLQYDWRRMIVVCLMVTMVCGDLCISTTTSWAVNRGHSASPVSVGGGAPAMMEKARGTEQLDVTTRIEEIMRRPEFQNARKGACDSTADRASGSVYHCNLVLQHHL
jgi:hypothetical protein